MNNNPEIVPLIHMWEKYPEVVKMLIKDPSSAFKDALKKSNELTNWDYISKLTEIFQFITENPRL